LRISSYGQADGEEWNTLAFVLRVEAVHAQRVALINAAQGDALAFTLQRGVSQRIQSMSVFGCCARILVAIEHLERDGAVELAVRAARRAAFRKSPLRF
jgi:hypothetical protein